MNRQLRSDLLRILNCYYEDMRYHAKITHYCDVSGVNAVTNGTPSFDSEEDLEAYLKGWPTRLLSLLRRRNTSPLLQHLSE
jgi:hypothetical protein